MLTPFPCTVLRLRAAILCVQLRCTCVAARLADLSSSNIYSLLSRSVYHKCKLRPLLCVRLFMFVYFRSLISSCWMKNLEQVKVCCWHRMTHELIPLVKGGLVQVLFCAVWRVSEWARFNVSINTVQVYTTLPPPQLTTQHNSRFLAFVLCFWSV